MQMMRQQQAQAQAAQRGAPLGMVWSGDSARALADDPEALARLLPLLPEELRSIDQVRHALASPQAGQAAAMLGRALDGSGAASLFAAAGLSPADGADAMAVGDSTGAFLDAMQARAGRQAGAGVGEGAGAGAGAGADGSEREVAGNNGGGGDEDGDASDAGGK